MSKKKKLIPELRFPEFKNEGEWEEKALDEVAKINPASSQLPNEFAYIDLESVENGVLLQKRIIKKEEAPSRAQRLLKVNDVIFQMVRPYQRNNYYFKKSDDLHYVASTGYAQLRAFESSMYLYQFIHTDKFVSKVLEKCTGSNYPAINSSDLSKILVQIPNPKEQQKIASCLSSLDDVIETHSQKLKLLKEHKKGLMQNLFPQEGEKEPKYRFKEFEKDGEWNFKKLNKLGNLINGLTYSPDDVREEGLLVLRSSNIQNGLIDLNDSVYVRTDIQGANLSKPNDILICVRNGSKNLIGKNAIIPKGMPLSTHGAFMTVFRATNPEFVFQLFQTDFYDTQVKADLGATINSINGKNFLKYEFPFPENPKEQQKIASCLSSLDELITEHTKMIEQLKQHKKGLMQGLFPKMND